MIASLLKMVELRDLWMRQLLTTSAASKEGICFDLFNPLIKLSNKSIMEKESGRNLEKEIVRERLLKKIISKNSNTSREGASAYSYVLQV